MILPDKVPMAIFVCPPSNRLQKVVIIIKSTTYQVGREGGWEGGREGGWEEGREGGREDGREGGREGRREQRRKGGSKGQTLVRQGFFCSGWSKAEMFGSFEDSNLFTQFFFSDTVGRLHTYF